MIFLWKICLWIRYIPRRSYTFLSEIFIKQTPSPLKFLDVYVSVYEEFADFDILTACGFALTDD